MLCKMSYSCICHPSRLSQNKLKSKRHLTYWTIVWKPLINGYQWVLPKVLQTKFLRSLITALSGVASALLDLEKRMPKIEVRTLKLMLNYWLKVQFFPLETTPINSNQWLPLEWNNIMEQNIMTYGLLSKPLGTLGYDRTKHNFSKDLMPLNFRQK